MMKDIPASALTTRWIFRVYGWTLIVLGFMLLGGNVGLSLSTRLQPADMVLHPNAASPWGQYIVIRIVGCVLIAAGMLALAFGNLEDPEARRRSLNRFAIAHVVFGVLFSAIASALLSPIVPPTIIWSPLAAAIVLGLFAVLQRPPVRSAGAHIELLRSQYEIQIREAARREERARLARDLHDAIKQQLFAIQTGAATVEARLSDDQAGALAAARAVRGSAHEALVEMDALIDQLQAAPMENTGLIDALRKQCDALGFRTGALVELTIGELPASAVLAPGAQEGLYRFAQEALANVARHARANRVHVMLGASRGTIELSVTDDGVGFEASENRAGMGRRNMAARAAEFGGECLITSVPERGTTVRCLIPFGRESVWPAVRRTAAWVAGSAVAGFLLYTAGGVNDQGVPEYELGLAFLRVFGIALAVGFAVIAVAHAVRVAVQFDAKLLQSLRAHENHDRHR